MARRTILKRSVFTALAAIIVSRFSPSLNCRCRLTSADGSRRSSAWMGEFGEKVAAARLRADGCKILGRNFKARGGGEVDIVARDGSLLLFVEVKTRREGTPIRPYDAVDAAKRKLIERGANAWLARLGRRDMPWQFDVMEVYLADGERPRVNRIRDAF
ncbi:MAG: YraN family protein [Verrucomicrobiaceae bacterium]|nr:MAG: YraN family protein [Verrucomicrobiaceae bacterium]